MNTARSAIQFAPTIVGAVLTATGALKAARPHVFRAHLARLGWIPGGLLSAAVVVTCFAEGAWGVALITGYRKSVLFPLSIVAFAALSTSSWIGVNSGKTEDCGCYGGVIRPSIYQSVALNIVYSLLIALAWWLSNSPDNRGFWRAVPVVTLATIFGIWSAVALRTTESTKAGSPLEPGKRWQPKWSGGHKVPDVGEVLVSFLGPDCPHCKKWVKIANAMVHSPALPDVLGVVSVDESRLRQFKSDYEINFPIVRIAPSRMGVLAPAVPTTVLIKDATISNVWVGNMPPDFSERFISAFFASEEARV